MRYYSLTLFNHNEDNPGPEATMKIHSSVADWVSFIEEEAVNIIWSKLHEADGHHGGEYTANTGSLDVWIKK